MKKVCLLCLFVLQCCAIWAQEPLWIDADRRKMLFPEDVYFTGFAYIEIPQTQLLQSAVQQAATDAQADLSKKIRIRITSVTKSGIDAQSVNGQYRETELFSNQSATATDTEVTGIKTDTYHKPGTRLVYAFAYVKKSDLSNYYKLMIETLAQQAEGLLHTATQLEQDGEKSRAKAECEQIPRMLDKIRYAQDILAAIDTGDSEGLQADRVEEVRQQSTRLSARLAQGIYLYVESSEELFGQNRRTIANKLKAQLANHGCSFVDDATQADYKLWIEASTRVSSETDGIVHSYADVTLSLYDIRKQRVAFSDELSIKGSSITKEKAGSLALDSAVPKIVERLKNYIK